jgi:hypothetical protein
MRTIADGRGRRILASVDALGGAHCSAAQRSTLSAMVVRTRISSETFARYALGTGQS